MIPSLETLVQAKRKTPVPATTLALDPGRTTGFAFYYGLKLLQYGHVQGRYDSVTTLLSTLLPTVVVAEDFRLYEDKAKDQAWNTMDTSRLLGMIEYWCLQISPRPIYMPGAGERKFVSDAMLKEWSMWQTTHPHAREATRHGCKYLIFGDDYKPRDFGTLRYGGKPWEEWSG